MKNIKLSLIAIMTIGTFVYAGGDFSTVTPYEEEDIQLAEEVYIEPEPAPKPEPVAVVEKPEPVAVVEKPKPVVVPKPVKDIKANGFYVGLGISATRYKTNCNCPNSPKSGADKTAGIMARVGYDFNEYIGIEARGIKTKSDNEYALYSVEHAGLFVKPMLPIGDATNIYGLIGMAKTKTKGDLQKTNAESLALGAGVEVDLSTDTPKEGRYNRPFDGQGDQERGLGLFVDYERMVVKSGAPKLDAVSVGLTYDF